MSELIRFIKESLNEIVDSRFYETERGFQGALLSNISKRISEDRFKGWIVEQEYQKTLPYHGIKTRPDIIIHEPFNGINYPSRKGGNFIVIELKLNASKLRAIRDYEHIAEFCELLSYPKGIFININTSETYFQSYDGPHKEKIHAFAVQLKNGKVEIKEEFDMLNSKSSSENIIL